MTRPRADMHCSVLRLNLKTVFTLFVVLAAAHCTNCPDTWIAYKGSCYLFDHGQGMSFVEAEHFCHQHSGHLVRIESAEENAFLKDYARAFNKNFWIGLTDERIGGLWRWYDTNKAPNYTDWSPGEPDDYQGREDCALLYTGYNWKWGDGTCTSSEEPLCEIRDDDPTSLVGK